MSDLSELYQQVILDHNKKPRNFRKLETPTRTVEGLNPLCGDQLTLYVDVEGDRIVDIAFQGSGCAISRASASMMTDSLKGKTIAEADALFEGVHRMLTADREDDVATDGLGKLAVLSGVREFPTRVKCASLSWHALRNALKGEGGRVSTE
jgi:nitrogen fixation protein NifU and related proteins